MRPSVPSSHSIITDWQRMCISHGQPVRREAWSHQRALEVSSGRPVHGAHLHGGLVRPLASILGRFAFLQRVTDILCQDCSLWSGSSSTLGRCVAGPAQECCVIWVWSASSGVPLALGPTGLRFIYTVTAGTSHRHCFLTYMEL